MSNRKEQMHRYYLKNKERILAKSKAYYESNKAKIQEQHRAYNNSDKGIALRKAYYENNREKVNAYYRQRYQNDPLYAEKRKESAKRIAQKKKADVIRRFCNG